MEWNKVVLIGESHHNGLGLVRTFGINGIKPYGIIIGKNSEKSFLHKSKYWKKTWSVLNEEDAVQILTKEFGNEKKKPVVIPWSDGMAELLDKKLNDLSTQFILPSLSNEQGAIVNLMDKQKQVEFAATHGIKMLETQVLEDFSKKETIKISYPRILKPVASIEGVKNDIVICENEDEFEKALQRLKEIGYKRILIQNYLKERKEYLLTGAVTNKLKSFSIALNIRQWPIGMGSGSYSELEVAKSIILYGNKMLELLQQIGFNGLIDIEIFCDKDNNFFINEFNWRSSGRNFVSLYTEVYSAYQYYCSVIGQPVRGKCVNDKKGFAMNEATDLRHVVYGNLSLREWLHCVCKTKSYALWYAKDLKPTLMQYFYLVRKMLDRRKIDD